MVRALALLLVYVEGPLLKLGEEKRSTSKLFRVQEQASNTQEHAGTVNRLIIYLNAGIVKEQEFRELLISLVWVDSYCNAVLEAALIVV